MRCKKCPMAKDECCTICDQNNFLTAERPSPERDELLAALKREQTINRQLNAIIENSADTLFATNGNGDIIKEITGVVSRFRSSVFSAVCRELADVNEDNLDFLHGNDTLLDFRR